MSGICGFIDTNKERPDKKVILQRMCQLLRHRGPDDGGFYYGEGVCLAIRSLNIIDLAKESQPIHNEDRTIWIVFNGEIYNFKELRENLKKRGHSFYTITDTEVIVHLYEDMKEDCVDPLNGMFAFAIWDTKEKELVLARDRMGIKPLHYTLSSNGLIFASELKAIIAHPDVIRKIDPISLRKYLSYEYVPCPRTIFQGINKVPPGHILIYKNRQTKLTKYWELRFHQNLISKQKKTEEYQEQFIYLFKDSVKRRLMSDVPLGVFLSGGIDSSSLAAMMCQLDMGNIKSFSIGFHDRSFDESYYAKAVSQFLGIEHYQKVLDTNGISKLLPRIAEFLDEPLSDPSIIPTYLLSEFTREYVTVTLSGEGGDELFCGYPTYQAHRLASFYEKFPRALRNFVIDKIVEKLPASLDNFSLDFKAKRFISGIDYDIAMRHCIWMGSFTPKEVDLLATADFKSILKNCPIYEELDNYLVGCDDYDLMEKIQLLDIKLYLQNDLLVKIDRASTACSLEARVPFLDHILVEFVLSLPSDMKLRGLTTKYILKKSMRKYLPSFIIDRPKKGLGIPVGKWLKSDLKTLVLDIFSKERVKREGFFEYSHIKRLLDEHFSGRRDNRKSIWTLLIFELWYENFMKGFNNEVEATRFIEMSKM